MIDLKDCSAEAMSVAVNFMYGFSIPGDFKENGQLLHLAELFVMENLKDEIVEISHAAQLYKVDILVKKCGLSCLTPKVNSLLK